jgi:hypothetical protein
LELEDIFSSLSTTSTQPPVSSGTPNTFPDIFSNSAPPPAAPVANPYYNSYNQPAQPNLLNSIPTFPQQPQRPVLPTSSVLQQQPDYSNPGPTSPVAPPSVTSPFAGLDIFSGLSSGTAAKTTKDLFLPVAAPAKTIQQMQIEKQVSQNQT